MQLQARGRILLAESNMIMKMTVWTAITWHKNEVRL